MSLTLSINPIRVSIGQRCTVTELLDGLRGLVVDLQNTTRPPPTSRVCFRHFVHASSTRRIGGPRVVGDGTREKDWGRQLDGVAGCRGKRLLCPAERIGGREIGLGGGAEGWGLRSLIEMVGRRDTDQLFGSARIVGFVKLLKKRE